MMRHAILSLSVAAILSGCASSPDKESAEPSKKIDDAKVSMKAPMERAANNGRVSIVDGSVLSIREIEDDPVKRIDWLKDKSYFIKASDPLPLQEVIKSLSRQGLNIVSQVPLEGYQFAGFEVFPTDGETLLKILTSTIGLDYEVDSVRKMITIKPMVSKTWYLNFGNRTSAFTQGNIGTAGGMMGGSTGSNMSGSTTGDGFSSSGQGGSSTQDPFSSGSQSGASGAMGTSGMPGGMSSGAMGGGTQGTQGNAGMSGSIGFDSFWNSIRTEMLTRLRILVPVEKQYGSELLLPDLTGGSNIPLPSLSGQGPVGPQSMGNQSRTQSPDGKKQMYNPIQIGQYAINPDTGALTVTAPKWKLDEINAYIDRVQAMYNTNISFEGELILVTTNKSNQAGLDLSSFVSFANKYGVMVQNNALGGLTVSLPSAANNYAPATATVSSAGFTGPMIGMTAKNEPFQLFSAYMASIGNVQILQKPLISTTSGVPARFSKVVTNYFNTVSQQAASGGVGGAQVATQNTLVAVKLGTTLKVNPRYDVSTGLVRAQIDLTQSMQSGEKNIEQILALTGGSQTMNTKVPIVTDISQTGEVLLKDGDMIILGGQLEDQKTYNETGLPGGKDGGPMGAPVLGKTNEQDQVGVYYFALRVKVDKRS